MAPTCLSSSLCCCSCSSSSPTSKCRRPRAGRLTRSPPGSVRRLSEERRSTRRRSSTAWERTPSSEPENVFTFLTNFNLRSRSNKKGLLSSSRHLYWWKGLKVESWQLDLFYVRQQRFALRPQKCVDQIHKVLWTQSRCHDSTGNFTWMTRSSQTYWSNNLYTVTTFRASSPNTEPLCVILPRDVSCSCHLIKQNLNGHRVTWKMWKGEKVCNI